MRHISSRQNPLVTRFRDLARGRVAPEFILLEGAHLVKEALESGLQLETVAFAERRTDADANELVGRVERSGADVVRVPEAIMAAMSPVRQPSGIVAIARAAPALLDAVLEGPAQLVLLLVGIQDAGNVGAIVRAADAAGASGLAALEGTADPFGWKALRGAMGSTFRVPIAVRQVLPAVMDDARRRHIAIAAAVPRGGTSLPDADLRGPVAILLGGEGGGLPDAIVESADQRITIPMRPPVESLNVAVTAALILYEASQQRANVAIR